MRVTLGVVVIVPLEECEGDIVGVVVTVFDDDGEVVLETVEETLDVDEGVLEADALEEGVCTAL